MTITHYQLPITVFRMPVDHKASSLVLTSLPGLPLVQPGDDLCGLILAGLPAADLALESGDVVAIAQKVVSKSEGCLVNLMEVTPSARAVELAGATQKDPRFVEVVLS